jgi:hypothetical protein
MSLGAETTENVILELQQGLFMLFLGIPLCVDDCDMSFQ